MGYIYDKLKEALGGSKFSSSHQSVVKDWTPNGVRAIIIYRDFILVANHVKLPKLYPLDVSEVVMDLQQNGRNGALHNLLGQRQLSCMEEFYVDGVFQNYRGALDLQGYITKLLNDRSRLRYYGYIDGVTGQDLFKRYADAKMSGDVLYSYARDGSRVGALQVTDVGNRDWYLNYNLRPQYYALDAENGELHRWFVKSEGIIASKLEERSRAMEAEGIEKALNILVSQDMQALSEVMIYLSLQSYLRNAMGDRVFSCVLRGMLEGEKNFRGVVPGLRLKSLEASLMVACRDERVRKNLIKIYRRFAIFDTQEEKELDLETLTDLVKNGSGLLQLSNMLDMILYEIWTAMSNSYSAGVMLLVIEARKYGARIPSGRFRELVGLGESSVTGIEGVSGFMDVLLGICGWNRESFRNYVAGNRKKDRTE